MRRLTPKKLLIVLVVVVLTFAAIHIAFSAGDTTPPYAYVVYDGTKHYLIIYTDLYNSFLAYEYDQSLPEAQLAKFYFDTLAGGNVSTRLPAYVSKISEKFVNRREIYNRFIATEDGDATYIWFNSRDATPAFPVKTKVWTVGVDATVNGRVWVDQFGYIIPRAGYTITANLENAIDVDLPAEFDLTATGDDFGTYPFTGALRYEVTGGDYRLEALVGENWQELTDGFVTPSGGMSIAPDVALTRKLRFTALAPETTYTINFLLEDNSPRPGLAKQVAAQSYQTTSGTAEVPQELFITLPGFVRMELPANQQTVAVNLHNPAENPCYFRISLALADGTVLYQSNLIPPGQGLYEIALSRALTAGVYDAVLTYDTFSLADGTTPMNGAQMHIELIVQ